MSLRTDQSSQEASSHGIVPVDSTWIPDSAASFHVTSDSQNIKQFTHFDGPDQIFIGNGEGLSISKTSSSTFISPTDTGITFKLHKLLHVPSILKNLFWRVCFIFLFLMFAVMKLLKFLIIF